MRKHYITFFILLFCCQLFGAGNNVYFNRITVKEGLTQNNIMAIYQDENGTMWFGGHNGLYRHNGQKIDVIHPSQNDEGLTQNNILWITGNRNGKLYILARRDLVEYDIKTQRFTALIRNEVRKIMYAGNRLWVAKKNEIEEYNEKTKEFTLYSKIPFAYGEIQSILYANNELWVGTEKGCFSLDVKTKKISAPLIEGVSVKAIFCDRQQNLWIGTTNQGVFVRDSHGKIKQYKHEIGRESLSNNDVRTIIDDEFGNIWIGTFLGLNKYSPSKGEWHTYNNISNISYSLSHSSVFSLFRDGQDNMWVGTYFGGVNYFNPQADVFNFFGSNINNENFISYPFVGQMTEDRNGNLWICTEGGGLNFYNRKTQKFKHFYHNENNPRSISGNNLKAIWYDKETHTLYMGSHMSGLIIYDINRNEFTTLRHIPGNKHSLPNNIVHAIKYYKDQLIILTQSGITSFDRKKKTFAPLNLHANTNNLITREMAFESFFIDSKENLWLSLSNSGLLKVNLKTSKSKEYRPNYKDETSIGKYRVVSIYEDKNKNMYFGTCGSGLYKYNEKGDNFTRYTSEKGNIYSNYCHAIGESSYDHLYILHEKGVSLFSIQNQSIDYSTRFPNINFEQGSSIYFTKDGETYFGSCEGLVSLYEQQLYTNYKDYKLYFDKLLVNNKEITPGDETGILNQSFNFYKEITLRHNQSNFAMMVGNTNFISNTNYKYEYKLDGFDDNWLPMSGKLISYTNINPGSYTLKVRSIEKYDPMNHEIEIKIKIRPPFYASFWAYLFYVLVVGYTLFYVFRFNKRQALLKASLNFERKEKQHIQDLNQSKLRFFTNISHEFRTPLSLIIAQLELLLQNQKLSSPIYNRILKVYKHTHYMRDLITELLDFRKLDQGYIKLHVEHRNIVNFINDIYTTFLEYAQKRKINYQLECSQEDILLWFDPAQMQKVINNLLSNAFKYTSEKGNITVALRHAKNQLSITVTNTGKGILLEEQDKIFERFYQTKEEPASHFALGSGIGLALTKGIVELHHGSITVLSIPNESTSFTVTLPLGDSHFTEEEKYGHDLIKYEIDQHLWLEETVENHTVTETETEISEEIKEEERATVLIVDDNEEILDVLKEILSPYYNIHTAINGVEGMEAAQQIIPDLIISDVMMPRMSGKEMCQKIKNSIELSHIPVVLLTAKNSIEYKIEGYQLGADDYITKPFNVTMLLTRCANLIRNRKRLSQPQLGEEPAIQLQYNITNKADQEFLDRVTQVIQDNISNPKFDMDCLANTINLGRSKLYTRIKEICGCTPNELTLKIRIEEGARLLLKEDEMLISEISYHVGFTTPKYFTKCFKSLYGQSPLEYKKRTTSA